jgi:hypothetical protein
VPARRPQLPERALSADGYAFVDWLWDYWTAPGFTDEEHLAKVKRMLAVPGALRHDAWSGRWPAGLLPGWRALIASGSPKRGPCRCCRSPPQVTAGAWVSALLRGAGPAAAEAAAGAALTAAVGPRALPYRQPPAAGPVLRVLTANLLAGWAVAQVVVELVRRKHADVLFVQELTDDAAARLQRAGLGDLLPYRVTQPVPYGTRGSIYARYPLRGGPPATPACAARCTARPFRCMPLLVCPEATTGRGRRPGPVVSVVRPAEDLVHDRRAAADGRDDHVAVDGLGDVGGFVADGVADVLERDAVAAHDRDRGVPCAVPPTRLPPSKRALYRCTRPARSA